MIESIRDMLIRHEGFEPHAYQDSLGYWTIGFGRLIDKRRGGHITRDEALMLLDNDITKCVAQARSEFPWFDQLDLPRQVVIVNMIFNLGLTGFKGFKNMIADIEVGHYENAAKAMLGSLWATQVGRRATELAAIMYSGKMD